MDVIYVHSYVHAVTVDWVQLLLVLMGRYIYIYTHMYIFNGVKRYFTKNTKMMC